MKNEIINILVSRFNWPHPKWKGVSPSEYRKWFDYRVKLFLDFTLPSIENCYVKPDVWFLLIDNRLINVKSILSSVLKKCPQVCFIEFSGESLIPSIQNALKSLKFPLEVRMTRMDSDDLVASDFFSRIKNVDVLKSDAEDGIVISFPGGCNYVAAEEAFYFSAYPDNPFLTYVEFLESPLQAKTVFFKMHTELCASVSIVRSERSFHPMWASVIHDQNTANDSLARTNKVSLSETRWLRKKFGILRGESSESEAFLKRKTETE